MHSTLVCFLVWLLALRTLAVGQNFGDIVESVDTTNAQTCYFKNQKNVQVWQLIWEDQFENVDRFLSNWKVVHDSKFCKKKFGTSNCIRRENARIYSTEGYLTLRAKHEAFLGVNYTGAAVRTTKSYPEGRYEIRAIRPMGDEIQACLTLAPSYMFRARDPDTNELDQYITVKCFTSSSSSQRVVFHNETSDISQYYRGKIRDLNESYTQNSFHLYGVEWNQHEVIFFQDSHYSERIRLNKSDILLDQQVIYLTVSILSEDFQHQWHCPALILDYIRVYKNVTNQMANQTKSLQYCDYSEKPNENSLISEICNQTLSQSMSKSLEATKDGQNSLNSILIITIAVVLAVIGILSTFLIFMFRSNKQRLGFEPNNNLKNKVSSDEDGYYEIPHLYGENTYASRRDSDPHEYLYLQENSVRVNQFEQNDEEYVENSGDRLQVNETGKAMYVND